MNKCFTCNARRRLYRAGFAGMWETRKYYCEVSDKIIDDGTGCKFWRPKQTDVEITVERLDAAIEDIEFISNHIKDE